MKCLVIGGAGFIGSHVSNLLVETGRDVYVLGRHPSPIYELSKKATYRMGDFRDRVILRSILVDTSEVIDLAYTTVPKTSFDNPLYDIFSNLPMGVTLLQEAAHIHLNKMVFVSSGGTVYGKASSLPIDETYPTNPISPYGITKLTMENYARMFALIYSLPIAIARPSNAYGEYQTAFMGQGFIATAIQSVLQGKKIDIYGKQGTIRDYLHALDIAQGVVSILEHGETGQAYNIGSGVGRNNMEVMATISPLALQARLSPKINVLPERPFDVPANVLSSQKLYSVSGWQPKISFEEGIRRVWSNLSQRSGITTDNSIP
jgi:UDP-glucose 4-epimerase